MRHSVPVRLNVRMGKASDLSDFERSVIICVRRATSSISEMVSLLGFSRRTVSRVYREWCDKQKTSSQQQSCGRKQLVDERSKENGKNHASEQANNGAIQQRCAERHLEPLNSVLFMDGLLQQTSTPGSIPIS